MATETQNYLDEFKTPSIKTPASANTSIKNFAPEVGAMTQQIALFSSLSVGAEVSEADLGLASLLSNQRALLNTLADRLRLLADYNATVRAQWRECADKDAEIRQYITDNTLGYTI